MTATDCLIGEDDLQALVDGRLPAQRRDAVDAWLAEHPDQAHRVATYRSQREALRDRLSFKVEEPIPARLRVASLLAERRRRNLRRLGAVAAAACWLGLGTLLGWYAAVELRPVAGAPLVAADALLAHRTFVREPRHPVEVRAEEEHLVRWLSNRVGRPLRAPELGALGWRLMGGRLLPAGGGPAAQLMYEAEGGRRLTIYVRADGSGQTTEFRRIEQGDLQAFYWLDHGFSYAIATTSGGSSLLPVAEAVYQQLENRRPPGRAQQPE